MRDKLAFLCYQHPYCFLIYQVNLTLMTVRIKSLNYWQAMGAEVAAEKLQEMHRTTAGPGDLLLLPKGRAWCGAPWWRCCSPPHCCGGAHMNTIAGGWSGDRGWGEDSGWFLQVGCGEESEKNVKLTY